MVAKIKLKQRAISSAINHKLMESQIEYNY